MHYRHDLTSPPAPTINFSQFVAVDIRIGRIGHAEALGGARKPAYVLEIDFGSVIGVKRSSAQITENYCLSELPGRLIAAVVNFPPRQIGTMMSEVLTVGFPDAFGAVVLLAPDADVPLGGRLF